MKTLFKAIFILFVLAIMTFCYNLGRHPVPDTPVARTKIQMAVIGKALETFYNDCGAYPDNLEQLITKPESCKNWGPTSYLNDITTDDWGQEFIYKKTDAGDFDVISFGADKVKGGTDINEDLFFPQRD